MSGDSRIMKAHCWHYWYVKCGPCFMGILCCLKSVITKEMKQCQINLFEGHIEVQGLAEVNLRVFYSPAFNCDEY
jgi:hypothetical protein